MKSVASNFFIIKYKCSEHIKMQTELLLLDAKYMYIFGFKHQVCRIWSQFW